MWPFTRRQPDPEAFVAAVVAAVQEAVDAIRPLRCEIEFTLPGEGGMMATTTMEVEPRDG